MKSMKKKVGKLLLSFTMVFAMVIVPVSKVHAAYGTINVTGTITNSETGLPLANTDVYILLSGKVTTDEHGVYSFSSPNTESLVVAVYNVTGFENQASDSYVYYNFNEYGSDPITHNISLTPKKYDVTITNGTESNLYSYLSTVTITANEPEDGKQFKEWTVISGGVTLADSKSATTTFTMPDKDVEVTATYEDVATGDEMSDFEVVGTEGEEIVPVEIVITTHDGSWGNWSVGDDYTKFFKNFRVTNLPTGLKATVAAVNENRSVLTLSITGTPEESLNEVAKLGAGFIPNANCVFNIKEAYHATVNNGTTSKAKYAKDETVTITANTFATGKQFKEWTVVSGGVTLANSKNATTTFTMPDNEVEVTATYEDIDHTHTPATAWSKDDTNHWHECAADGQKMELATHTFGEWVINTPATESAKGSKHRDCTVCGHRETVEIPATAVTPKKDSVIKDTASPKTDGDSILVMFAFLLLLSGCAVGYKRKKSINN